MRVTRLRALRESPGAFAARYEDELCRPDDWWESGARRLAWFVAEDPAGGGDPVGLVAGAPPEAGETNPPEVVSMWVDPAFRATGAAAALLGAVVGWARRAGARELALWVAGDNERAARFYRRAGFVGTGGDGVLRNRPSVCTTELRLRLDPPAAGDASSLPD